MAIITVEKNRYTVESLYQWDKNQVLTISGLSLPSIPEIHYTNDAMDKAIVRQATMDTAGVIRADIPNSLLQKPYKVKAYVCVYTNGIFETLYCIEIPMKARNKPKDYTIETTDGEIYSFNELDNKINNILVIVDDSCRQAVNTVNNARDEAIESVNKAKEEVINSLDEVVAEKLDGTVAYDVAQTLDDTQKARARENIGAIDASVLPTKMSQLNNDSGFVNSEYVETTATNKVNTAINSAKEEINNTIDETVQEKVDEATSGLGVTTKSLFLTTWADGEFTETLSDGRTITYNVTFDTDGKPTKINDCTITW